MTHKQRKEDRTEIMSQNESFSKRVRKFLDTFEQPQVSDAAGNQKFYTLRVLGVACSAHTDSLSLQTLNDSFSGPITEKNHNIISITISGSSDVARLQRVVELSSSDPKVLWEALMTSLHEKNLSTN